VETHADLLSEKAAVYINGDNNGRGFLSVGGSHTLEKLVNEVARDVIDPEKKIPVADRLRAYRIARGSAEERREVRERSDLRIYALGSGSDYTPFLQHLGIASLDIRFGGEDGGGSYHSIYDSFDHYTRFGDPGFDYGIALAQTAGRVILRLANAEILPFEFTNFADTIRKYLKELAKLADDLREETKEMNRQIQEKTLEAVFDPTQTYVISNPKSSVPYFNFAPLENAVANLQEEARNFEGTFRDIGDGTELLSNEAQKSLDAILMSSERTLLLPQGLPRRPWFRHLIYAPGFYTGYGVKTLPGVREAIEERNWTEADQQIEIAAKSIERFSAEIKKAQEVLDKIKRK
jgi:N-acetylated-alpha-linked acidic dipeptidase